MRVALFGRLYFLEQWVYSLQQRLRGPATQFVVPNIERRQLIIISISVHDPSGRLYTANAGRESHSYHVLHV